LWPAAAGHNNHSITSALGQVILAGTAIMTAIDEAAILLQHLMVGTVAVYEIAVCLAGRGRGYPWRDHFEHPVGEHANDPHFFTSSHRLGGQRFCGHQPGKGAQPRGALTHLAGGCADYGGPAPRDRTRYPVAAVRLRWPAGTASRRSRRRKGPQPRRPSPRMVNMCLPCPGDVTGRFRVECPGGLAGGDRLAGYSEFCLRR